MSTISKRVTRGAAKRAAEAMETINNTTTMAKASKKIAAIGARRGARKNHAEAPAPPRPATGKRAKRGGAAAEEEEENDEEDVAAAPGAKKQIVTRLVATPVASRATRLVAVQKGVPVERATRSTTRGTGEIAAPAPVASAQPAYGALTVVALRDMLRPRGLHVSGRKAELIARLKADDDERAAKEEEEKTATAAATGRAARAAKSKATPAEPKQRVIAVAAGPRRGARRVQAETVPAPQPVTGKRVTRSAEAVEETAMEETIVVGGGVSAQTSGEEDGEASPAKRQKRNAPKGKLYSSFPSMVSPYANTVLQRKRRPSLRARR